MSSFSIVDKKKVTTKYRVLSVPIFSIPKGGTGWNNFLKPNAFSINNTLNQSVLFTGHLSGTGIYGGYGYTVSVEIKIRFNPHGKNEQTDYTYEILSFPIMDTIGIDGMLRFYIPINFVKTFSELGLYDVYIYIQGTSVSGTSFTCDTNDVLYLNATFYHNDTTDIFSTPAYILN